MFGTNSYATIKSVESKGKYSVCKIRTSAKNRDGNYETDFIANVRFLGNAHQQKPLPEQRIKITSCGVQNCYVKDDKLEFPKNPSFLVFGYELVEDCTTTAPTAQATDVFQPNAGDDDLPF